MGDLVIMPQKPRLYIRKQAPLFAGSSNPNFPNHSASIIVTCLMELRFTLLLLVLFFCMAQVSSETNTEEHGDTQVMKGPNRRLLPFVDCGGLCKVRCSLHSRQNVCNRACGTCCARCKCVPPGTSGNREMCGRCYIDMRTHGNKPKCP